jgi:hypothetical protein
MAASLVKKLDMIYWTWVHTNNVELHKHGRLDLRYISEAKAKQLLLERCRFLKITPEGQQKPLFKANEIVPLVKASTTMDEAADYARLSNAASVRNALTAKAQELVK